MSHDHDEAGEDVLAGIDLHRWRVPPAAAIDRPALLARALAPATTRTRRARAVGILAAIGFVTAAIVAVIIVARRPGGEPVTTVEPVAGVAPDARHEHITAPVTVSSSGPAPCTRPQLLPVALPLMPCPLRSEPARCTARCGEHDQYLNLYYRGVPPTLSDAWRKTLEADGWATSVRESSLDPDRPGEARRRLLIVEATKGRARLTTAVMTAPAPAAKGETRLGLTFTPDPRPPAAASGAWSPAVDGIAGRLRVEADDAHVGGCRFAVRVELRSKRTDSVRLLDQAEVVRASLFTSAGDPVSAQTVVPASGPQPMPRWLTLAPTRTLPVRIDAQTVGLPAKVSGTILLAVGATWMLAPGDYVLEATVSFDPQPVPGIAVVPPDKATSQLASWNRTLVLPPVRITVTSEIVGRCEPR